MKKIYLIVLLFNAFYSSAQVGIGTTTPDASAALDLTSTTQGFLPPRMTATERDNIVSSATGLVIYNTTTNTLEYKTASGWVSYKDMPDGTAVGAMNYWDGTNWVTIAPGANGEVLKFVNNAPAWGMVEATVPDAPTIVSAVAGTGQAIITFNAPTFNGYSTITSYTATASPGGFTGSVSQSSSGSITVTSLTNGTSYTFSVTATNAIGTSVASAESEAVIPATVPDAPTITSVVAGNGQATISFNAPDFNGYSTITSYTATSSPGGFTGSVTQSDSGTIIVGSLTSGTSYTFTVTATNALGTSVVSNVSEAVIPATVPDAPTITSVVSGSGQATITFTAPANNGGSTITSYTATSSPGGHTGTVSQSGAGSITVTGLSSFTSYTFTITATNSFGTSQPSSNSNTITTPNGAPNAPTIMSAVAGNTQATITFTAPENNGGSTITSYTATSSPGGFTGSVTQSDSGSIIVGSLTNGTSYTFTVTATNALGTSVASNVSEAVIPGNSIYDNLATTAFGIGYGNKSKIGQQFLATGGGQLVQVDINLFKTTINSAGTGPFTVELWSNIANSTRPLAKLATLNSSDWSNMPLNSITPYSITSFTENYSLVAGTYYWLVVSQPVNGGAKVWATNGSGLGQTAVYNNNTSTWTNTGSSENFGARIKTIN